MRENSPLGDIIAMIIVVAGVIWFAGAIIDANETKCIKPGCNNRQASDSSYCYAHEPCKSSSSSYGKSSGSSSYGSTSKRSSSGASKSTTSKSTTSKSNTTGKSTTGKNSTTSKSGGSKNYVDSYDDGYDDILMDGDYDYDRYDRDSGYADGVDDAIDELGGDW
ncbi:MAG: hypothetical protein MRZ64_05890 [[Bacteroides] pectinophilus]|nr:hypothetical protein [[Bacteroides] pectinophilus]